MYSFGRWGTSRFGGWRDVRWSRWFLVEFIEFMRPKICLFITGIGMSGFLLFNPMGRDIIFVMFATYFISAASYSYNLITDREEDMINHKKINWFVTNRSSYYLVLCFLFLGFLSVLHLSYLSIIFYVSATVSAAVYSYFRIKNIFPTKNLYTGASLSQAFVLGAANAPVTAEMLLYVPSLFLLLFVISLISDLRDYEGDKLTEIRTVPVVIGYGLAKKISYAMLIAFTGSVFVFELYGLLPLIAFILPILTLVYLDKQKMAHLMIMVSFMCLPGGIFIMNTIS